ncbi:GGDEF: diguanylate cyclase (GGDEF) domain [Rubrobacter radiotolerans]|uniref:GGDEF: diguanylate cyclase (GGDEF) domain n=1 Tax=Rubrobacter radiotolerans TaxID=42256 RepID=A0A023X464_RUBRA|nr:GGDEF: diguanylate cyclase (GGDEF) domain [Rubrobacter radiotolerans]
MHSENTTGLVRDAGDVSPRLHALTSAFEHLGAAVLVTKGAPVRSPGPEIVYANAAFYRMTGYSPGEIIGRTPRILQGENTNRASLRRVREALERGEAVEAEMVNYRKDGSEFWVDMSLAPVFDKCDGKDGRGPEFWVSVQRETTRRKRAERELDALLAQYGTEMVAVLEPDGTPRYQSPAVGETLGYDHAEIVGEDYFTRVHPEDAGRLQEAIAGCLATPGESPPVEFRIRHADGTWRWFESRGNNLSDNPEVGAIVVRTRDVTDRREAEERLKETEEKYRTLVENVPGITYIEDGETAETLYDSPQIEEILGYERDTYKKDPLYFYKIMHPEDRDAALDELKTSQKDGTHSIMEYRVYAADGRLVWLRDEATVVEQGGRKNLRQGFLFDITERKRTEQQLRETEQRYRTLVEQIPAATYVQSVEHSGTLLYASPRIEDLLGYPPESFVESALWRDLLHPDDREAVLEEGRRADRTGERFKMEYRMVHRDGRTVWILDDAVLLHDAEGEPSYWHGIMYDVTGRKRAEAELRAREERFRSLVQNASDLIAIVGRDRRTLYLSPSFERVQGYNPDEHVGKVGFEAIHPEDLADVEAAFRELLREPEKSLRVEFRLRHRDGSWLHLEAIGKNLLDDPAVGGVVVNARDVTERRRAEQALKRSEDHLKSVTSAAPIILFALDREGTITLARGRGLEALGIKDDLVGQQIFEVYREFPAVLENVQRALAGEEVARTVEIGSFFFDARYSPVRDERGEVTGVIGVATDITERQKLERELEHRAFHDPLTGLANRALCMDRIEHALERARRRNAPVTLLFMDLDDFKVVNDSLGHTTGDELLVEVASRLRACVRPGDTLARLGGDEFVVLLEETDLDGAVRVTERISDALGAPFYLGEARYQRFVNVSVGITVARPSGQRAGDLLREADLAMYRAKEDGKAGYKVFDAEMGTRTLRRVELESDLRRGLENGEFELHYQPVVSLPEGRITGFEALVRWRHPERGLVSPAEFIGLMEKTGLIVPLGRWVLEEACRDLKRWQDARPERWPLEVCVNLSARQFRSPRLYSEVARTVERAGVRPETVNLEITESVAMSGATERETLKRLRELGVGLKIDDFGTGQSSLAYLKHLPVDALKICRIFAKDLARSATDREIVGAIVRLGHALGLRVIAEGVETPEQLEVFRQLGCDLAQGYLFSRPVPAADVLGLLAGNSVARSGS